MKTSLKVLSLLTTASVPSAFLTTSAGIGLPAGVDVLTLFSAFVASMVMLIGFTDYTRSRPLRHCNPASPIGTALKAAHPLAA
jgi:hypothetical protein